MNRDELFTFATSIAPRYDSAFLHVTMLYYGQPMANELLPPSVQASSLMQATGRATLLAAEEKHLYILHRINGDMALLTASDVSGIYALRHQMVLWTIFLSVMGIAASVLFSVIISSRLTKPMRQLVSAAEAMRQGDYTTSFP